MRLVDTVGAGLLVGAKVMEEGTGPLRIGTITRLDEPEVDGPAFADDSPTVSIPRAHVRWHGCGGAIEVFTGEQTGNAWWDSDYGFADLRCLS